MAQTSGARTGSRNRTMIVAAIVFAAIAALLLFVTLRSSDSGGGGAIAPVAMADVVVATQDIRGNTKLTADMIEVRSLPEDQVLLGAYTSVQAAIGLPVRYPLQAGEQLTTSKVGLKAIEDEKDLALVLDSGMRAFALSASEVTAVGGLLLPKNYVDVVAVFQNDEGDIESVATVLENIQVLGVAQEALEPVPANVTEDDSTANGGGDTGIVGQRSDEVERQPGARSITLAVTPDQVQLLAGLQSQDNVELWLSLRPLDDNESGPQGVLSAEQFGLVSQ
ncbi:MAG: Flp pilus assembly protein CpaB [Chloroflexi bacterium]|nr:Flp pilus assembly protein CpaB [Chloroflexota bacterium]